MHYDFILKGPIVHGVAYYCEGLGGRRQTVKSVATSNYVGRGATVKILEKPLKFMQMLENVIKMQMQK